MTDHFSSLSDQDLLAYSDDVVGKFQSSCRLANEDDRLRSQLISLLNSPDAGESFDRLSDKDPQLAEQLLRLGLVAMISSRMILLAQKELMKRGVIPTPTDF
jgi:hypothetical protein